MTALFARCEWCTGGCDACRQTGYVEQLFTLEQVRAVLDGVPNVEQLKCDLSILRSHNNAYAAENARRRLIINEGTHAPDAG